MSTGERAITEQAFRVAIEEYQKQQATVTEQLRHVEEQRAVMIQTLDRLTGAIVALETLVSSSVETPVTETSE
jgi:hypothetical protein